MVAPIAAKPSSIGVGVCRIRCGIRLVRTVVEPGVEESTKASNASTHGVVRTDGMNERVEEV